jgi:hypothetical protein
VTVNFRAVATVPLTGGTTAVTLPPQYRSGLILVTYSGDQGYYPAVTGSFLLVH